MSRLVICLWCLFVAAIGIVCSAVIAAKFVGHPREMFEPIAVRVLLTVFSFGAGAMVAVRIVRLAGKRERIIALIMLHVFTTFAIAALMLVVGVK